MIAKMAFKTQEGRAEVLNYYDMLLKKLTIPYEELFVNTHYGKTHIIAVGDRSLPPMILLHGSSMNSGMWIGDIPKYYKKYRIYAIDLPGEAGKSDERQLPFTTTDFDDWLNEVITELAIDKATIIGASLGAWLSTKYAIRFPNKVNKLVLLCPAGIGSQNSSFIFIALFHMLFGEKGIRRLFKIINGNGAMPEIIINYQKLIAKNFNTRKEPIPIFTDEELRRLSMPVYVYVGAKDVMLRSMETAERIQRLLPTANVTILPEAGHSLSNLGEQILEHI